MKKLKIARVVSVSSAYVHIYNQIMDHAQRGHEVSLISHFSSKEEVEKYERMGIEVRNVLISREIKLFTDLKALLTLTRIYRQGDFDVVHSSTPKAGLLSALAAFLARVPVRLHTFTGQRWQTLRGGRRKLLVFFDKLIVALNTHCYADSSSQVEFLLKSGIGSYGSLSCLGHGSFGGIDFSRFNRERLSINSDILRQNLDIGAGDFVFIFLGRIVRDKGVEELVDAFMKLSKTYKNAKLLMVGPFEEGDPIALETKDLIKHSPCIRHIGFQKEPEKYLVLADVFCLPSYREGFGTTVLEAAALGIPAIGTKISGLVDAIEDGKTGLLVNLGARDDLIEAMVSFVSNPKDVKIMGTAAKTRAREKYDFKTLSDIQMREYQKLVKNKT